MPYLSTLFRCVRPPKHKSGNICSEAQAALEGRIQRLEAKLAEMKALSQPGSMATNNGTHLPLHSVTGTPRFEFTPCSDLFDDELIDIDPGPNSAPPDIPMIQISPWDDSPPAMLSPATSPPCLASEFLTPEPCPVLSPMLGSELSMPSPNSTMSPPVSAAIAPTWHSLRPEDQTNLNLGDLNVGNVSRQTSVSSFNSDGLGSAKPEREFQSPILLPTPCERQSIGATKPLALAMQQTASYRFWEEAGAVEAALLIALFAMTSSA
ncbi:uncharacterized protein V1513DRAFT_468311 [Lipomyces chichibuensis]|uniref:uncharacterized protein n=1 Tax=Lipomyces chichibuensis TaxID=1546026 RepID=UPI003343B559